jgi:hypothetical protein
MPNILARKSGEGQLPLCKIWAKSESYNLPGLLISGGEWLASHPDRALPLVPTVQETGWASELIRIQRPEEKSFASVGDRTPLVQSVARHYTEWTTPAPVWVNIVR